MTQRLAIVFAALLLANQVLAMTTLIVVKGDTGEED